MNIVLVLLMSSAFAAGPFGNVTSKQLNGIDQKGCVAGKILEQEYLKNGVNIVDGSADYVWDCKGVTSQTAGSKRCPYPQNVQDLNSMKCYSNSSSKGPVVCVAGASSETIDVRYADSDSKKEIQPRFRQLVVMTNEPQGDRRDRSITMDAAGCAVKSVDGWDDVGQMNNGSTNSTFENCSKLFDAALSKFCDDSKSDDRVNAYWTKIKKLNHCFVDIPDFLSRYKARSASSSDSKSKEQPGTTR